MMVQAKFSAIKGIKPHEWVVRFVFGGAVCVLAGLISKHWGAAFGGLFLAFPAIFPAGASLLEAHERKHKARAGLDGTLRGRTVAGLDAAGAAIGCIGLAAFAVVCWLGLGHVATAAVFTLAAVAWLVISAGLWLLRKSRFFPTRKLRHRTLHAFRPS
jgi:hypothetical protein